MIKYWKVLFCGPRCTKSGKHRDPNLMFEFYREFSVLVITTLCSKIYPMNAWMCKSQFFEYWIEIYRNNKIVHMCILTYIRINCFKSKICIIWVNWFLTICYFLMLKLSCFWRISGLNIRVVNKYVYTVPYFDLP